MAYIHNKNAVTLRYHDAYYVLRTYIHTYNTHAHYMSTYIPYTYVYIYIVLLRVINFTPFGISHHHPPLYHHQALR